MADERAAVKTLQRGRAAPGPSARSPLQDTVVLGRYRLLEQIGAGGHGSVWVARDEHRRQLVAVKRIPLHDGDGQERLRIEREGRAAARLSHPAIVQLYDSGDGDGAHYLVSELVEGASLARLYREQAIGEAELIAIGVALADALEHAHERGVVHRDVKPANVIVPTRRRGGPAAPAPAKLTDFGVARLAGETGLTHTGDVIGTLAYMAPEQADGLTAGPAADLYSLALTLYEGFTGANPLRGETVAATARRLGTPIPPLAQARRDLPRRLCAAVDRALATAPGARGTIAQLRGALVEAADAATPRAGRPAVRARARARPRSGAAVAPRGPAMGGAARARRLAAGVLAGTLCGAVLGLVLGAHGFADSACIGAGAALLVAASPGLGWLLLALGAIGWLGAIDQPGTALVAAAGLAPVALLLAGSPWLWTAPALAPLLGLVGLATAAPAAAGRAAGRWYERAALGALSYWWLALAETLTGHRLLLGAASGVRPRAGWQGSLTAALHHALVPLASDGRLVTAAVWGAAAMSLPWLVRGPHRAERAVGAGVWAGALVVASIALSSQLGLPQPSLPLLCWALAALVAYAGPSPVRRALPVADVA